LPHTGKAGSFSQSWTIAEKGEKELPVNPLADCPVQVQTHVSEQPVNSHSAGTQSSAGVAEHAARQSVRQYRGNLQVAFKVVLDDLNPASRGIVFLFGKPECGTDLLAQSALKAVIQVFFYQIRKYWFAHQ